MTTETRPASTTALPVSAPFVSRPASSLAQRSFIFTLLINTLFFSGYYILKDPLAYILQAGGMSLTDAYSITTTANVLLALCSLFFGFVLSGCGRQKHSLFIGVALSVTAIFLLACKIPVLTRLAVTLYIVGGGLYFFSIVIFINHLFDNHATRMRGNYLYQIFVNVGGCIGCSIFLMRMNSAHVFYGCLILGVIALLIFAVTYRSIQDDIAPRPAYFGRFYAGLIVLALLVFTALTLATFTRIFILLSFSLAVGAVILRARHNGNRHLLQFLGLVFLFNIPYWLANTVIATSFFYFLTHHVSRIHGVSPAILMLADPLANTLFGVSLLFCQWGSAIDIHKNLSRSLKLLMVAFVVLAVGLYFSGNAPLAFVYPLLTIVLFACAEFLLQTTLRTHIRDLLQYEERSEFMATGMLRASRAFATVIGYYLLTATHEISFHSNVAAVQPIFWLYFLLFLICLTCYVSYRGLYRFFDCYVSTYSC